MKGVVHITIDEALIEINRSLEAWVVWREDTGDVLSVKGFEGKPSSPEMIACLQTLQSYGHPVMGRFVDSSTVTREFFEKAVADSAARRSRVEILTLWSKASVAELVTILESGEYVPPMNVSDGRIIVDHLWELHRDEVSPQICERLRALIGKSSVLRDVNDKLRVFTAALDHNVPTLKALWADKVNKGKSLTLQEWLIEAFFYVGAVEEPLVDACIHNIESGMPFGAKYDAMINLGGLGQIASQTADVIRRVVFDSEPYVIAGRDRVLERLSSPDDEWERCTTCSYGRVHAEKSCVPRICGECLGIGYVRLGSSADVVGQTIGNKTS